MAADLDKAAGSWSQWRKPDQPKRGMSRAPGDGFAFRAVSSAVRALPSHGGVWWFPLAHHRRSPQIPGGWLSGRALPSRQGSQVRTLRLQKSPDGFKTIGAFYFRAQLQWCSQARCERNAHTAEGERGPFHPAAALGQQRDRGDGDGHLLLAVGPAVVQGASAQRFLSSRAFGPRPPAPRPRS